MRTGEENTLFARRHKLTRRILELCRSIDHDLRCALEIYFDDNAYAYFALEEKLQQMKTLFETLEHQGREAATLADLSKVAERMSYVEEQLDELESRLYRRRRRKGSQARFADFFRRYHEQQGSGAESQTASLSEAYATLGLQEDAGPLEAATAFRRLAKKYHPDARGGDRSEEVELRRIVGAYQYIKGHFGQTPI